MAGRPFPSFDVDILGIMEIVEKKAYHFMILQVPEGLKRGAVELAGMIKEKTGARVWIDGESCYGACDHSGERARILEADAVIHVGHADIPSMEMEHSVPVHFFHAEMTSESDLIHEGLDKLLEEEGLSSVALFTTIQHISQLEEAAKYLKESGLSVHIGEPGPREEFPGQILGCSFHAVKDLPKDTDLLLFIGTGRFHPLGVVMGTRREVRTLDPISGEIDTIDDRELDRFLRSRYGRINRAEELIGEGETVGIVLGTKPGQRRSWLTRELSELCDSSEVKNIVVTMDLMAPMKLRALGLKVVCSTACPRIAMDDSGLYSERGITLITPLELRIALGRASWKDYSFDEEW